MQSPSMNPDGSVNRKMIAAGHSLKGRILTLLEEAVKKELNLASLEVR